MIERVLLASVGVCLAAAAAAVGQELIDNGGFEADPPSGTFFIADRWAAFETAFREQPSTRDPANFPFPFGTNDGTWAIKTFGPGSTQGGQSDAGVFQIITSVTPGEEYVVSAFTLVESGDPIQELVPGDGVTTFNFGHIPLLIIDFRDAGGATVASGQVDAFDFANDSFDEWIKREFVVQAPPDAATAQITCLLVTFDAPAGSIWWDSVSVVPNDGGACPPEADYNNDGNNDALDIIELLNDLDVCAP